MFAELFRTSWTFCEYGLKDRRTFGFICISSSCPGPVFKPSQLLWGISNFLIELTECSHLGCLFFLHFFLKLLDLFIFSVKDTLEHMQVLMWQILDILEANRDTFFQTLWSEDQKVKLYQSRASGECCGRGFLIQKCCNSRKLEKKHF